MRIQSAIAAEEHLKIISKAFMHATDVLMNNYSSVKDKQIILLALAEISFIVLNYCKQHITE